MSKKSQRERHTEFLGLLDEHGLTMMELAARTSYSYGTVRQWKCGARSPSRHTLRTIKLILNQPAE